MQVIFLQNGKFGSFLDEMGRESVYPEDFVFLGPIPNKCKYFFISFNIKSHSKLQIKQICLNQFLRKRGKHREKRYFTNILRLPVLFLFDLITESTVPQSRTLLLALFRLICSFSF